MFNFFIQTSPIGVSNSHYSLRPAKIKKVVYRNKTFPHHDDPHMISSFLLNRSMEHGIVDKVFGIEVYRNVLKEVERFKENGPL
jgi:hypothetical protein